MLTDGLSQNVCVATARSWSVQIRVEPGSVVGHPRVAVSHAPWRTGPRSSRVYPLGAELAGAMRIETENSDSWAAPGLDSMAR
jgi:hypothetical protein